MVTERQLLDGLMRREPGQWLWPAFLLAALVVFLNAVAWMGRPLAPTFLWVWTGLGAAAAVGVFRTRRFTVYLGAIIALVCAWLAVSDAAGRLFFSQYVSSHPDAWSYDTLAGYLADYGRNQTAGMPLVDQFASHLRNSRLSSSCILALLESPFGIEGKFIAHGLFYILTVAVGYCSMAALAATLGFGRLWASFAAAASVLIGWTSNAIVIGNYDNLCFAALLPAALALFLRILSGGERTLDVLIGLALISAAVLYTYPEGAALCGPAILPILILHFLKSGERIRPLGFLIVAGIIALLICLPYAPHFLNFLSNQMTSAGTDAPRPGSGNFPGLLTSRAVPSVFALGAEYPTEVTTVGVTLLGGCMLALLLIGTWRMSRDHRWYPWSVGMAAGIFLWQALSQHYDYGAYKVIYCHAWLLFPALAAGARHLCKVLPRVMALSSVGALGLGAYLTHWLNIDNRVWQPLRPPNALAELSIIRTLAPHSVHFVELRQGFDQLWAVSFLRGLPLVVVERQSYLAMDHVQNALSAAAFSPSDEDVFVLTEKSEREALWKNDYFQLSRSEEARIVGIENPNGVESVDGRPFFWIGHSRNTLLTVYVIRTGDYELVASRLWPGLSSPGVSSPTLVVHDASGERRMKLDHKSPRIRLHLSKGTNEIALRVEEAPTVFTQPNGDTRELMLGLLGFYLKPVFP